MSDPEADIKRYARAIKRRRDKAWRQRVKSTPVHITWTPPPTPPRHVDWRVCLDRRISRCPGCDDWRFDATCSRCAEVGAA